MRTLIADQAFAIPCEFSYASLDALLVEWRTTGPKGFNPDFLEVCPEDIGEALMHWRKEVRVNSELTRTNWRLTSK